ncbi:MAG: hypothetical protein A2033_02905 [Bacteroidetes bacterium GWA2_31_9]|nr:MAG: hypothetical protein A2033_02905 [Bacteroidetes bacterium GWA2_31_9]
MFRLFIIFLLINISLQAQDHLFINYTTKEGLPSDETYHVFQDSKGFIWFATNYGVSKFDGFKFTNYSTDNGLLDNTITEIYEDFEGKIWFISLTCKFTYYFNNKIYQYEYNDTLAKIFTDNIHPVKKSFCIDRSKNLSFCLYREGLFIVDSVGNIKRRNNNYTSSIILIDENKNTRVLPIYRQYSKTLGHYLDIDYNNKLIKTNLDHIVTQEYGQSEGACLVNDSLVFFYGKTLYILHDNKLVRQNIYDTRITWISFDCNAIIWVGTAGNGIFGYESLISKTAKYHLFKNDIVTSICLDNENSYWFTTYNSGIKYISDIEITKLNINNLSINEEIRNIVVDKNNEIWCSDGKNYIFNLINDINVKTYILPIKNDREIHQLFYNKIDDLIYICTNLQLFKIKSGVLKGITMTYPEVYIYNKIVNRPICVYCVENDSSNNLFLSISGCILETKNDNFNFDIWDTDKHWTKTNALKCDKKGNVWLATEQGLKNYKNHTIIDNINTYPKLNERLSSINIDSINGDIWIGSKGQGLFLLKNDTITKFTTQEGLCSNYIKDIYINNSVIWISSESGISRIEKHENKYIISNLTTIQGFPSEQVYGISSIGNIMYAATDKGLIKFNEEITKKTPIKPKLYFENILINNIDTIILPEYILEYNQDFITFKFLGLYYKSPESVKYKFSLIGLDKNWNYSSDNNIQYTNLRPGDYTFEVYAYTEKLDANSPKISVKIHIKKPYYNTWWFYTSLMCFIIFSLLTIYYIRIKEIRKKNNLKMDLLKSQYLSLSQQMKPHFIFNTLNSIGYYVYNNDQKESFNYISKFSSLMRKILDNSRNQLVSLQAELEAIETYIELESYRFKEKLKYSIDIDENIDSERTFIPTFLIQPYIENSIWHGLMHKESGGLLQLIVKENQDTIKCEIIDNGIGRKNSEEINSKKRLGHVSRATDITSGRAGIIYSLYKQKIKIETIDLFDINNNSIGTKVCIEFPNNLKMEKNDKITNS